MNPELFTNISKEYNEQERKLAIRESLRNKINPVIQLVYWLLFTANAIAYFYTFFTQGHRRSLWLSLAAVVAIGVITALIYKKLRARLYPKAEAACTVTVPQWSEDRFPDMEAILEEKARLQGIYNKGVLLPLLPVLISTPILLGCCKLVSVLSGLPTPRGLILHLVMMCIFYSIYGYFVILFHCETSAISVSRPVYAGVNAYLKEKAERAREEANSRKENQAADKKVQHIEALISRALRQDPPDFELLYKAAEQGAPDAIHLAGRALVPLIIQNYPKAHQLEPKDQSRRRHYRQLAERFSLRAEPLAASGDGEAEFALMAAQFYSGHPCNWEDLRDHNIPRLKVLQAQPEIAKHWGTLPGQLISDMEEIVRVGTQLRQNPVRIPSPGALSNDILDDADAIRSTLAKSGLCEQPTDLSQDV